MYISRFKSQHRYKLTKKNFKIKKNIEIFIPYNEAILRICAHYAYTIYSYRINFWTDKISIAITFLIFKHVYSFFCCMGVRKNIFIKRRIPWLQSTIILKDNKYNSQNMFKNYNDKFYQIVNVSTISTYVKNRPISTASFSKSLFRSSCSILITWSCAFSNYHQYREYL